MYNNSSTIRRVKFIPLKEKGFNFRTKNQVKFERKQKLSLNWKENNIFYSGKNGVKQKRARKT